MSENGRDTEQTGKREKRSRWILLLIILLLLLLFLAGFFFRNRQTFKNFGNLMRGGEHSCGLAVHPENDSTMTGDSVDFNKDDSAQMPTGEDSSDAAAIRVTRQDAARTARLRKQQAADSASTADSLKLALAASDSISAAAALSATPCSIDTVPPWIFPDPSGGLHRRHVSVHLLSVEGCDIEWRFSGEKQWRHYADEPILITGDTSIIYTARDSCGNRMAPHTETYKISRPLAYRRCPEGMEFVKVDNTEFCIDRFEWPNRRGEKPHANISFYQARDSCFTAGKRLCSTDEWTLACGGAYAWRYPYGSVYEPEACNTRDTLAGYSGTRVECRGYFDVYDMSGNLAEWTNTPSDKNRQFYNVMGGFWGSGPQAGCFERRHSYFPVNSHNPVGFRCCSDADTARAVISPDKGKN